MEIFLDGGVFEIVIAAAFGYLMNFIFRKRYLLILFSAITLLAPPLLFFFDKGEIRYWLIAVCLINSVILSLLLWKQRTAFPGEPLVDMNDLKSKFYRSKAKVKLAQLFHRLIEG